MKLVIIIVRVLAIIYAVGWIMLAAVGLFGMRSYELAASTVTFGTFWTLGYVFVLLPYRKVRFDKIGWIVSFFLCLQALWPLFITIYGSIARYKSEGDWMFTTWFAVGVLLSLANLWAFREITRRPARVIRQILESENE